MPTSDPRVRRTRARLQQAVLALLEEGVEAPLSVAEIARRAEVNRATVYLHYGDVDALVADAVTSEVLLAIGDVRGCPFEEAEVEAPPEGLLALFARVAVRHALYARLLGAAGRGVLEDRLTTALADELTTRFDAGERPPHPAGIQARVHAEFLTAGLVRLLGRAARHPADHRALAGQTWLLLRGPRPEPTVP